MAVTEQYVVGNSVTLMSTELNALASSSSLNAGAISAASTTNTQGDAKGNGYTFMNLELKLAAQSGAVTAGSAAYIWFLANVTSPESGGASAIPARAPDAVIPLDPLTSSAQAHTQKGVAAPVGTFTTLLAQNSGQAFAATGNTLVAQYYTRQGV